MAEADNDNNLIILKTSPKGKAKLKARQHRRQRYRKEWEDDPAFKPWLQGVSNPFKAKCRVCNAVMVAELTVIKNHARGKKHASCWKTAHAAQGQLPYSFKNVICNEHFSTKITAFMAPLQAEPHRELHYRKEWEDESVKKAPSKWGPHQKQHYREEWEDDPAFKPWLEGVSDPFRAKCRVCNVVMVAELTVIKNHARGKKHGSYITNAPADQAPPKMGLHRKQRYRKEWEADPAFKPWLEGVSDPFKAKCRVCNVVMVAELTVVKNHAKGKKHGSHLADTDQVSLLKFCQKSQNTSQNLTARAETKLGEFLAEHNIPYNGTKQLTDLLKDIFPDSKIAQSISLKDTKQQLSLPFS